jgi:hypothetical protein
VDWQAATSNIWAKKMERPIESTFGLIDTYCREQAVVVTKSDSLVIEIKSRVVEVGRLGP